MPQDVADNFNLDEVVLCLAGDEDHSTVRELFKAGLLEGHVPANDTGADVENLREAYFSDEGQSALWVAQYKDQIIGMVGVQRSEERRVGKECRSRM